MEVRINVRDNQQLERNGKVIVRVVEFVHLESIVRRSGGTGDGMAQNIMKFNGVFPQLTPIW